MYTQLMNILNSMKLVSAFYFYHSHAILFPNSRSLKIWFGRVFPLLLELSFKISSVFSVNLMY